jgi:hypothetical protein
MAVVCLASAAWAFGFGVNAPLAALWLQDSGCSHKLVGLNTSTYYLGVALASPLVPLLMRHGGRGCMIAGMFIDGLTVVLFPWARSTAAWFGLRLLGGAATALCLIPMETWVNQNAPPGRRASDFGIYAFCVALGLGFGPLAGLPLYALSPHLAFALGGGVALAGAALIHCGVPPAAAAVEEHTAARARQDDSLLSLATAWAQGFLEGGMLTFLPVYLLGLGYSAVTR